MSRRKKTFLFLTISLIVVMVAGYFIGNAILERMSRQTLTHIVELADKQGLEVVEPNYDTVKLAGPLTASWSDVRASIKLPDGADSESDQLWDIHADYVRISKNFSASATITVDHVTVTSTEDGQPTAEGIKASQRVIELNDFCTRCNLRLLEPGESIRDLLPEVVSLLSASSSKLPLELTGTLSFSLKDKPIVIGVEVHQSDESYTLRLNPADLADLSDQFDEALTSAEVAIIADYPLRAARLLEIKDSAETTSRQAHQQDDSIPEDAYRHVLWSYLLAKTYSQEFAERVGDAHEAGETGNTPAERDMDYHNNGIGRRYAELEYSRNSILKRILADPEVRRTP